MAHEDKVRAVLLDLLFEQLSEGSELGMEELRQHWSRLYRGGPGWEQTLLAVEGSTTDMCRKMAAEGLLTTKTDGFLGETFQIGVTTWLALTAAKQS